MKFNFDIDVNSTAYNQVSNGGIPVCYKIGYVTIIIIGLLWTRYFCTVRLDNIPELTGCYICT